MEWVDCLSRSVVSVRLGVDPVGRVDGDASSSTSTSRNDAVLVAVVKLFKETRVAELSLLEATRDEYITRHLIDGRFIYCDHRISVVSGYFPEEVSGLSAFKFMHKEDFLYTMIALRQMYDRYGQGEGYGSSVYRLRCKNGQFIFMRTHGYVEYSKTTHQVESFICVNSFISDEEGLAGLKEMRSRYSASVISSGRAALVDSATANGMFPSPSSSDIPASPEDSNKAEEGSADPLDVAISQLISNLPQAAAEDTNDITSPLPDIQYVKVVHFSKSMPPPHLQAAKAGVYAPTPRYEKRMPGLDSPESVPPISPAPSTPDSVSTASSGSQDRPTVITERPSVFSVNPMARPSAKSVCVPARTESVCVKSSGATTTVLKRAGSSSDCDRISPAPKRLHASYRNRKREQASPSSQVETEQCVWPKMSPEQQHKRLANLILQDILSSPQGSVLLRSISPSETGQSYSTRHSSSPQGSVLLRSISPSETGKSYSTRHSSSPQGSVLLRSISPSETGKSYSTIYPGSPQGSVMLKVNQTIVHSPAPSSPLTYPDFSGGSHPLSPFHMMGGPDLLGYQSTAVLSPHTDSNSFSSLGMVDTDSTAPTDLIDMLAVNTDALRSGFILDVSDGALGDVHSLSCLTEGGRGRPRRTASGEPRTPVQLNVVRVVESVSCFEVHFVLKSIPSESTGTA
uniref:PAS domain-containing protein n=2 Tax=Timema TaxID=61471 RepID=A0A7R9B5J3_TIMSH|nr:unnamed protein product [Timema shepardi]